MIYPADGDRGGDSIEVPGDHETIVQLIGSVRTTAGLRVEARLDTGTYPTGIAVPDADLAALDLTPDPFHGDWNYTIQPRRARQ